MGFMQPWPSIKLYYIDLQLIASNTYCHELYVANVHVGNIPLIKERLRQITERKKDTEKVVNSEVTVI